MIKKIKIDSIFVNPEVEIVSKKEKTLGKKYKLCKVSVKTTADSKEYPERYLNTSIFEYVDAKDKSKNRSATDQAEHFKSQNDGQEILVDVTESEVLDKEGRPYLNFKKLTKAQKEVAAQFIK